MKKLNIVIDKKDDFKLCQDIDNGLNNNNAEFEENILDNNTDK